VLRKRTSSRICAVGREMPRALSTSGEVNDMRERRRGLSMCRG
jgi:hypothetical protein